VITSSSSTGPLLLFPDTSALLPMLGAGQSVAQQTPFTLDFLAQHAQQQLFGRALPQAEQVQMCVCVAVIAKCVCGGVLQGSTIHSYAYIT
jgi:hypothetical protein